MNPKEFITFLNQIEKLKCTYRHSWTSAGRQESVAEHSWRLACMALLCRHEFENVDINKVIAMCLIHDFGEAVTGDIPAFNKTIQDETEESIAVEKLLSQLPIIVKDEFSALFYEMNKNQTKEAKLFHALDKMEALISHNEAPLETWIEREYVDNLEYGQQAVQFSDWTLALKEEIKQQSIKKINDES
ncbi:MAG: HD domain-containing protein [Clostridia bacterium]|nr:HD domain-containing protein [Clostridia bacterium]